MKAFIVFIMFGLMLSIFGSVVYAADCGGSTACNCGDSLTSSRTLNITDSLTGCPGNGINIATASVTLDCNGTTISGLGSSTGVNVSGSNNAIINNCTIHSFADGINVVSSSNVNLANNTIYNITSNGNGIAVQQGSITADNNNITGVYYGIFSSEAGLNITDNEINGGAYGIYLGFNTGTTKIIRNNINGSSQAGIQTLASASSYNITENNITENYRGLVIGDDYPIIYHNNIYNNSNFSVYGYSAIDLSYNNEGNYWGRDSCPVFMPIIDSNAFDVFDQYAYKTLNGWLTESPVDCPPMWAIPSNITPLNYSYTTYSQFNITWGDEFGVDMVFIEIINYTNASQIIVNNASMTNITLDTYNYSIVLPAGTWNWTSYANDTAGNWSKSDAWTFTIEKAAVQPSLLNNTSLIVPYLTATNISCYVYSPNNEVNCSLYRNDTGLIGSGVSVEDNILLGVGIYNYSTNTSETSNYSANVTGTSINLIISKPTPILYVYIDEVNNDKTIEYPSIANISASKNIPGDSDCVYTLWRNETQLINGSEVWNYTLLGNGTYEFKYNTSGTCTNFTLSSSQPLYLYVNKGSPNISIWLNGTEGSKSYNQYDIANFTAQVNTAELTINLTSSHPEWVEVNNTTVYNTTNVSSPGIFNITAYTPGNENYTGTSKTYYFDTTGPQYNYANETPANDSYYAPNQNYSFNITITDADFDTIIFKIYNATNVSGNVVDYTVPTTNYTSINATTRMYFVNLTDLPAGTYNYSWFVNDTTDKNYTTGNLTYIIRKSVYSISITASSSSVSYGTSTTVTCINNNENAGRSEVTETLKLGTTVVGNPDTQALPVGTWTYYCTTPETGNYSSSQQIVSIIVTQVSAFTPTSSGLSGTPIAGAYVIVRKGSVNITTASITTSLRMLSTIAKYEDVAIRGMNISVINNVENVKIMITKIALLPSTVPFDISGIVYHYINIERINITDSDISVVNIGFAVNKTWLTDNNLDASNITLYRWANNKWNDLNATKISETTDEVFYNANSRGLSVFIIGTTGGAPPEPEITGAAIVCDESWSCTDWTACTNNTQTRTCTDSNNCGTVASKPSESQSCETEQAAAKTAFSILTNAIIIVGSTVVCILIFLQRTKITSYLGVLVKKVGSVKKPKKAEEKEKAIVKTS